ncbi:MAG: patatin-like phospholipase family protein [Pseudomonadales bacterium]|jgi:NTE family protein|nr:patatin-like phospholipase family protein [Pseudomonadales bacterium]MCP5319795.1 patatin-like phospholipase family protein [Pseudomonadales bacterium]
MRVVAGLIVALLLDCWLAAATALAGPVADDRAQPPRPRVGLVLAGGGARGLAHIGVIRFLEEHGIQVDAIAGTSMGAIVGAMYASGLDATGMEEVATTLDWKYAFDDTTPRDQLSLRRKQEDLDFLVRGKLRYKDGRLRLPMGAIEGQHLNMVLHDIIGHVARVRDFDALPIPFRAVATDIETGEAVVIGRGDLATAMRASMSIPGMFSPVELDGRLLVDGGIANSIPVDVAQAMGVDRLIVIDVGTPLYERARLDNVLTLMDQLTTIMTRGNSQRQLARLGSDDVLITPLLDPAGVTTMSFEKAAEAIALGYEAAARMQPELAALAGPPRAPAVAKRPRLQRPHIDAIRIESDASVSHELLRNMVTQPLGAKLNRIRIERDIAEIYGLDEFSRVDYDVSSEDGQQVLTLHATAHPAGISYLRLGLGWDQDSRGSSDFALRAGWRQKGINRLGAEWFTLAQLGGRSRFMSEFHQPLDTRRRLFVDTRYEYQQRQINVVEHGSVLARVEIDQHRVEIAPGLNLGNLAALRVGAYAGTANATTEIGRRIAGTHDDDDGGWFAELHYDSLDRTYFPTHGLRFLSRFDDGRESWGASTGYEAWSTRAQLVRSFGSHVLAVNLRWSELDFDLDPAFPDRITLPSQVFTLGGFQALSGYTRDSLAGNYAGLGSLVYYRRLNQQSLLPTDLPVYAGASIEAGNVWLRRRDATLDDLIVAGSLFLGVDSPLGPVFLGAGVGERGQRALYLRIGQQFE